MDLRKHNGKSPASRRSQKERIRIKDDPSIIRRRYESGETLSSIAKSHGVTAATVLKFCRDHGIPRRTKSEIQTTRMRDPVLRERNRERLIELYLSRRKCGTKPERDFEQWLRENNIEFESQYRRVGNKHPYDYFLPQYNLLVEIDGHYWHSKPAQKIKDRKHNRDAKRKGYNIVRINTQKLKKKTYDHFLGRFINRTIENEVGS